MDMGDFVFRKVIAGDTLEETLSNCCRTYGKRIDDSIKSGGFKTRAYAERHLRIESVVDSFAEDALPKILKGLGYSRLKSIFAWPFEFPAEQFYPHIDTFCDTVIKIEVDGSQAIVMPMAIIDDAYNHSYPDKKIRDLAFDYWSSAVTLQDFKLKYREAYPYNWRSEGHVMDKPEVLIPAWTKISLVGIGTSGAVENGT
jgi:hypothetical protein